MANLSQQKRERMISVLKQLKESVADESILMSIAEIENELLSKKYGLVWEQHEEQVDIMMRDNIPVFTEVADREIVGNTDSSDYNFLLEGDNLHCLKLLEKTHKGKIDVIYIDPPYNTKNKEFVYDDRRIGEDDAYRHSMWLSFMEQRLLILRRLLSERGVIFISIDDNEQANLKLLCDGIWGEKNFIAMAIHKNNSSKNQAKFLSVSTEYVLIYAKNIDELKRLYADNKDGWKLRKKGASDVNKKFQELKKAGFSLEEIEAAIKDMYRIPKYSHLSRWNKVNENGVFKDADLSRTNGPKDYTIVNPETGEECVIPDRGWGKSYEELLRLQREGLIWYGDPTTPPGMISYITGEDYSVPDSFWYYDNSIDTKLIRKLFGKDVFNNPKPLEMIISILEMVMYRDCIVLDVFAGSGTTGHAVLELNLNDGGNRKFILCTNNENKICEEVAYGRIKKIIQGYSDKEPIPANLKYYKTEFVAKRSDDDFYSVGEELEKHIKELLQLERGISLDSGEYLLVLTDEDADMLEKSPEKVSTCKGIYISNAVFLTKEQEKLFSCAELLPIPDYYFEEELREVGEL